MWTGSWKKSTAADGKPTSGEQPEATYPRNRRRLFAGRNRAGPNRPGVAFLPKTDRRACLKLRSTLEELREAV